MRRVFASTVLAMHRYAACPERSGIFRLSPTQLLTSLRRRFLAVCVARWDQALRRPLPVDDGDDPRTGFLLETNAVGDPPLLPRLQCDPSWFLVRKRTKTCRLTTGGGLEEDLITLLSHDFRRSGQCGTALTCVFGAGYQRVRGQKRCRNRRQTNSRLWPMRFSQHLICKSPDARTRGLGRSPHVTTEHRLVVRVLREIASEKRPVPQRANARESNWPDADAPNNLSSSREQVE
jgi:hypothetical protein